jgi:imidazolonepropionase-like amidohydrolase
VSILIHNCTVIDGVGDVPLRNAWVLIDDGKILRVGTSVPGDGGASATDGKTTIGIGASVSADEGVTADTVIDAHGGTLLPGLMNLHVHIQRRHLSRGAALFRSGATGVSTASESQRMLLALRNAWYELSLGITTLRDLTSQTRLGSKLRDSLQAGIFRGPRMISCGTAIACTGGHGTHRGYGDALEADGPDEVAKAVRREIKEGAEFIKLMASGGLAGMPEHEHPDWVEYTLEELRAGVEAAHSHGKTVTVHAMGEQPPLTSLRAGVDGIEHGTKLTDEAIDMMLERGVYYVPTMSGITSLADREAESGNARMAKLVREVVVWPQRESVRRAHERGVLIGAGTDTLGELVHELELMEECGLSRMEAIKTATSNAAKIIGMESRLGQVKEGYLADLLLVKSDPLQSLANLRDVSVVISGGSIVTAEWISGIALPNPAASNNA